MKSFNSSMFIGVSLLFSCSALAQVGIGTQEPKAALDIQSSESGILIPRLTTQQRDAIVNPPEALLIYNSDLKSFEFYNGSSWSALGSGTSTPPKSNSPLYFSEYGEGTGNNKYLEIYNPTDKAISLLGHQIWRGSNGNPLSNTKLDLVGEIEAYSTFVVANPNADPFILSKASQTSGLLNFTGDDALALVENALLVDVIGKEGEVPTGGWKVNQVDAATQNHTLRRDPSIGKPKLEWVENNSDWIVLPSDTWTNLGIR
ncbi:MAG: hypothetical protein C4K58_00980 [Flavobacteriaceae bacterium]|nr:MAG: hypothetical protein C4K58_00980 [Flavobacteriaceae bacterium]